MHGSLSQSKMLIFWHEDNPHLSTLMSGLIITQVYKAHGKALRKSNCHPYLMIIIEITGIMLDVFPKNKGRIGNCGISTIPQSHIVLYQDHQFQVLWLYGSEYYSIIS